MLAMSASSQLCRPWHWATARHARAQRHFGHHPSSSLQSSPWGGVGVVGYAVQRRRCDDGIMGHRSAANLQCWYAGKNECLGVRNEERRTLISVKDVRLLTRLFCDENESSHVLDVYHVLCWHNNVTGRGRLSCWYISPARPENPSLRLLIFI